MEPIKIKSKIKIYFLLYLELISKTLSSNLFKFICLVHIYMRHYLKHIIMMVSNKFYHKNGKTLNNLLFIILHYFNHLMLIIKLHILCLCKKDVLLILIHSKVYFQ